MFRIARRALLVLGVLAPMLVVGGPDPVAAAPSPEAGLPRVSAIAVGGTVACAASAGNAYCWGDESGGRGQIGDGPSVAPFGRARQVVNVAGTSPLGSVSDVAAGDEFACAIASPNHTVYCWGANDVGQLGNGGSPPSSATPVVVTRAPNQTLQGAIQVDAFASTACATVRLNFGGGSTTHAYCWGEGSSGQIGDGLTVDRVRATGPVKWDDPNCVRNCDLTTLPGLTKVTVGASHACALLGGEVWCWGANGLQSSPGPAYARPVFVGRNRFCCATSIDAGGGSTCAVTDAARDRTAYCWGSNDSGQLGVGTFQGTLQPAAVQSPSGDADLTGVSAIAVGQVGACASLITSGRTMCWGEGLVGEEPTIWPSAIRNPSDTGTLVNVRALAVGAAACGQLQNRQVRCWGRGAGGTLGNGSPVDRSLPVVVLQPGPTSGPGG